MGVVYYELLKPNETITGDCYRLKLMHLNRILKETRPLYEKRQDKVILQHDNARPHVAKPVKTYLETLKWEVLPHPPYSPDIAPSDYNLFRSMARLHIYKPYPDRTEAGNQSLSLATRSSDVVFSSRTQRTAILTKTRVVLHFFSVFPHLSTENILPCVVIF
ncbi:Mariner Mos1 transposase [Araneus ventricosus]|uniref:Mariner Mos1 transposase n=1 Tax=Araneus ventricosus TaxID=182803 RepID=A0A4Y2F6L9_ARAVE|nr:Mariner Mos1 transposase [Araneus ventricosus]